MFFPEDACRELHAEVFFPDLSVRISGAGQDTRTLRSGHLFIALKGTQQDGHDFLDEAFRRGAAAALVRKAWCRENQDRLRDKPSALKNLLAVDEPEAALVSLARWRRSLFQGPVIGVTGSVGKTSTKEMLGYLLSQRRQGLANSGNFNNQLGLPMTLVALDPGHEFCLAELGASRPGDIRDLAEILKPTHGLITQISPSHLGSFGSLEAIYQTKLELAAGLPSGGTLVLPDSDPVLIRQAQCFNVRLVLVGESASADYRIADVRTQDGLVIFSLAGRREFRVPALASFFAKNAAMAAALADILGFPLEEQPQIWEHFKLPSGRFEARDVGGLTVIYDGYNASPASFERSLEAFSRLEVQGRKAVVFADMLELGPEEARFHRELGLKMAGYGFDFVGAYGPLAAGALAVLRESGGNGEVRQFQSAEEAGQWLSGHLKPGDALLLKASRGMRIEKVLRVLEEKTGQQV